MRGTWQATDSDGGRLVLAVIAAVILLGSGAATAIASALVTILIVLAAVIVLAIAGVVALLVHRARQDRPGSPIAARPVHQLPPEVRPHLEGSRKTTAIEPPREVHQHWHLNVTPDQLAAIMRHHLEEDR